METEGRFINRGVLNESIEIKLTASFGNTSAFLLNRQHAIDLWDIRNHSQEAAFISRYKRRVVCLRNLSSELRFLGVSKS